MEVFDATINCIYRTHEALVFVSILIYVTNTLNIDIKHFHVYVVARKSVNRKQSFFFQCTYIQTLYGIHNL